MKTKGYIIALAAGSALVVSADSKAGIVVQQPPSMVVEFAAAPGPAPGSPNEGKFREAMFNDLVNHTGKTGSYLIAGNYEPFDVIYPKFLVTSNGVPGDYSWLGKAYPAAPNDLEYGTGERVGFRARASVPFTLSQVGVTFSSNDMPDGGSLGYSFPSLASLHFEPNAVVGWTANGQMVTSGPSDQPIVELVVTVLGDAYGAAFNGDGLLQNRLDRTVAYPESLAGKYALSTLVNIDGLGSSDHTWQIVAQPVPEPSAFAVIVVGSGLVLGRRRRA